MRINLPESSGAQAAALGELAEAYLWTRDTTELFNTGAAWVLVVVHTVVTEIPPTETNGNTAVWGPHSEALDPAEWRLTVTELADGTYDWALDGRNKGTQDAPFLTIISGSATPGAENRGTGSFLMDFEAIRTVDPINDSDAHGTIEVSYDLENRDSTQASLDMHIDTYKLDPNGAQIPIVADYHYGENADGSGDFVFSFVGNIDDDTSEFEDARIRSRWAVDGAGRADVSATGGDLGTDTATFSQCWSNATAPQFASVFEDFEVNDGGGAVGDEADCAFAAEEVPGA